MSNDQSHFEPHQEVQIYIRDEFSILTFQGHLVDNQQSIITLKMSRENCKLLKKIKGGSKRPPYIEIRLSDTSVYPVNIHECQFNTVSFQTIKTV